MKKKIVIENVERIVKMIFYFSLFVKCKNTRESDRHPNHRLCTSRCATNFKLLKISKIVEKLRKTRPIYSHKEVTNSNTR